MYQAQPAVVVSVPVFSTAIALTHAGRLMSEQATMSATIETIQPPSRIMLLLETRALHELAAFAVTLPSLGMAPRGDGHSVLVLPGLMASDVSTQPLRAFLQGRGYDVHGWGLGRNFGLRPNLERQMLDRVRELRRQSGRKVSLIGWSLGGIYARQLAKRRADDVRLVITLGSPFAGSPRATHAWRIYELASGRSVDEPHSAGPLHETPPVPTTAIFSRSDGICAWQCCVENEGPQVENIEVDSSHCGLGHHPAVVYAIADRLAQPEGEWKAFRRPSSSKLIYPDSTRSPSPRVSAPRRQTRSGYWSLESLLWLMRVRRWPPATPAASGPISMTVPTESGPGTDVS
jgi:pimeloyl-ACP methyl ester carboxylesterase